MGEGSVPVVVYAGEEEGTQEWERLCGHVKDTCEAHGFFILRCDSISKSLHRQMLDAMKELFDLPTEIKNKYQSPLPYRSYTSNSPVAPLLESFSLEEPNNSGASDTFAAVFWSDGNPMFSQSISNMASKMAEINQQLSKMIFHGFHVDERFAQHVASRSTTFRLMKYNVPPLNTHSALGLRAHTDKDFLSVLCQNDVDGLEVLSPDDIWRSVVIPEGSFVIFAGDVCQAWSNGRIRATKHRVMMTGDRARYTWAMFSFPTGETNIEVPPEFVDEDHPLLYRPFNYSDFLSFFAARTTNIDNLLDLYAGVRRSIYNPRV